jgi:uncharacterized peroxidase-related enzyme
MPYINLENHLPGITGLLEYRRDTAEPIRQLTQFLLRGPSTLTKGERELIATVVSDENKCVFCTTAHATVADLLLDENETSRKVRDDISSSHLSGKIKSLLFIARAAAINGDNVTIGLIENARKEGATDIEIHDTVLIASLFCLYNRYVDGLNTVTPQGKEFYHHLAKRLVSNGYKRLPQGYDHLKIT